MVDNRETPLLRRYHEKIGGTLIREFLLIGGNAERGLRRADGLIIPDGEDMEVWHTDMPYIDITDKDVILVQVKRKRIGMHLAGQALFSIGLLKMNYRPKSVRSVALCGSYDSAIGPLLEAHGVEIVLD